MSTSSTTLTSSWSSEAPDRSLVDFLARESPRYVPLQHGTCDAVFVNHWFNKNLLAPPNGSQIEPNQRLLELMRPEFYFSTVLGIKHLVLNRHGGIQDTFHMRWSAFDENHAEVFLISCYGVHNHVAVMPTAYLRRRYGLVRSFEGIFEPDQACPTLMAPFMVHHHDVVKFLDQIYYHASISDTSDLINPTFSATYYTWRPELGRFADFLPRDSYGEKLRIIQTLYLAGKLAEAATIELTGKGEAGHFTLNGRIVEYWRRAWTRCGKVNRVSIKRPLSVTAPWTYLLLEDWDAEFAICLPRDMVPGALIGRERHRGGRNARSPLVEIEGNHWAAYTFTTPTPAATLASLLRIIDVRAIAALASGKRLLVNGQRDGQYESTVPIIRLWAWDPTGF